MDLLVELAAKQLPPGARVLLVGGPAVPSPRLASRRVTVLREDEALPFLQAHAEAPFDGVVSAFPTAAAPLLPLLSAMRGAVHDQSRLFLLDLVWQTAPTPELMRAFAPPPGRERVRPVEGYEMQMEHAGFDVTERHEGDRAAWARGLPEAQRAAVMADTRGAARLVAWVLKPTAE